ncbi:hypothetical protein B0H34DRAFT_833722 [Crassisporium funariophilum]|nr:hypothetical protein B0H34DRAFT_833722 [Crassisporium funariophilum]
MALLRIKRTIDRMEVMEFLGLKALVHSLAKAILLLIVVAKLSRLRDVKLSTLARPFAQLRAEACQNRICTRQIANFVDKEKSSGASCYLVEHKWNMTFRFDNLNSEAQYSGLNMHLNNILKVWCPVPYILDGVTVDRHVISNKERLILTNMLHRYGAPNMAFQAVNVGEMVVCQHVSTQYPPLFKTKSAHLTALCPDVSQHWFFLYCILQTRCKRDNNCITLSGLSSLQLGLVCKEALPPGSQILSVGIAVVIMHCV